MCEGGNTSCLVVNIKGALTLWFCISTSISTTYRKIIWDISSKTLLNSNLTIISTILSWITKFSSSNNVHLILYIFNHIFFNYCWMIFWIWKILFIKLTSTFIWIKIRVIIGMLNWIIFIRILQIRIILNRRLSTNYSSDSANVLSRISINSNRRYLSCYWGDIYLILRILIDLIFLFILSFNFSDVS